MYLWEMKKLPDRADKAVLEWGGGVKEPSRDREHIALPAFSEKTSLVSYFPLQEGRQFIITLNDSEKMWFGGTDEEPFLVELEYSVARQFLGNGGDERMFYNSLVPDNVNRLSEEVGIPYRRQGDIFAARFSGERNFENRLVTLLDDKAKIYKDEFSVFGTRHQAKGLVISIEENHLRNKVLFRGKIEAPDHKPLILDDGLYLLGQTKHIVNPRNAD